MESINKLIERYGVGKTAEKLGISKRYVWYLAKEQNKAGLHLSKEIDRLVKRVH